MVSTADDVAAAAAAVLTEALDRQPQRMELGYGNENWRVDAGGRGYLFKIIGANVAEEKAAASSRAYRLAAATAAPVPRELHFDAHSAFFGGRMLRVLSFLPGRHPEPQLRDASTVRTFFESFGRAVADLHSARCDAFASRVGGRPSFPAWLDYVEFRVPQIIARCRQTGAFTETEIGSMFDRALATAAEVSELVQPRLCHRDLYLDNVLIGSDGRVSAILDLDLAEPWDPAVDFVKPRSQVFANHPGAGRAFERGYVTVAGPLPDAWEQRVRVAEVLELSNHVANALAGGNRAYAEHNRRRLGDVLAASW